MKKKQSNRTARPTYVSRMQLKDDYGLSCSSTTIWRWQMERGFPAGERVGGREHVYRRSDVEAWIRREQRRAEEDLRRRASRRKARIAERRKQREILKRTARPWFDRDDQGE